MTAQGSRRTELKLQVDERDATRTRYTSEPMHPHGVMDGQGLLPAGTDTSGAGNL